LLAINLIVFVAKKGEAMGNRPSFESIIKEKMKVINISDGVSREEAIIIAQNYLIDKGINNDCIIAKPQVIEKGWSIPNGTCEIRFEANRTIKRKQGLEWFSVYVDIEKGGIEGCGWGPDL